MNILSCFDGISIGQLALKNLNIPINKYYSSEIDKNAIKVTQQHFPNTIQLGDIQQINSSTLDNIDVIIGGSPCQNFSSIGNKQGLEGTKSKLFFQFVKLIQELHPKFFFLENVASMSIKNIQTISNILGIQPVKINSNIFVPCHRRRLYWTNIPLPQIPTQPVNISTKQFLNIDTIKVDDKYYLTSHQLQQSFKISSFNSKPEIDQFHARPLVTCAFSSRAAKDNLYSTPWTPTNKTNVRMLTPNEFELLQGIPENYTEILKKLLDINQLEIPGPFQLFNYSSLI